jgi:hypothetical protein
MPTEPHRHHQHFFTVRPLVTSHVNPTLTMHNAVLSKHSFRKVCRVSEVRLHFILSFKNV